LVDHVGRGRSRLTMFDPKAQRMIPSIIRPKPNVAMVAVVALSFSESESFSIGAIAR
jgi:hypothetical protein